MSEWMPKKAMCKKCRNLVRGWCKEKIDSPDPDLERYCQYFRERTNADRIRAMTDEELAEWILSGVSCDPCDYCKHSSVHCISYQCKSDEETILEWLRQPVKED